MVDACGRLVCEYMKTWPRQDLKFLPYWKNQTGHSKSCCALFSSYFIPTNISGRYTEDGTQVDAVDPRPLLYWDDGRPFFFFSRRNLTGSPRSSRTSSIPPITDIQADALDALHFSALKHCIRHRPVNGELQIINNLSVVHCREHFVDPDNESGRHLMRIWLRNDDIYHANLDHVLTRVFGDVFAPARIERAKWEVTGFNEWDALVDETSHTST